MQDTDWLLDLKKRTSQFLNKLKGEKPGFFHYSLSGDLYDENVKWGLGNTVFAVKIYYTLNLLDSLEKKEKQAIAEFIRSFQKKDGRIYDSLVQRKAFLKNALVRIKNLDLTNIFGRETSIAETRQSMASLQLLGEKPEVPYQNFPKTEKGIEKYVQKLNWKKPWGAGSHFSHLIFFLKNSDLERKEDLIDFAINWVNKLQNPGDGAWYKDNPNLQQKVNGTMKIITGLKVADKVNFKYPEKLIDLCLSAKNNEHACDNFNVIYTLHYASKTTDNSYRFNEIRNFARDRLKIYRKHYFPEIGGFSFLPNRSNVYYYGAKIGKGSNEPDIHGTCMFLWGISIINQILEMGKELEFKELVP